MSLLITPPAAEPVSRTEAKLHLHISGSDEDTWIDSQVTAARIEVENRAGRALILQTRETVLDDFPGKDHIRLDRPPLRSVVSLKYKDSAGAETTWAASNYIADIDSEPGRLVLGYGLSWPSLTPYPTGAVRVRYRSGYVIPFTANASTDVITATGHPYIDTDVVRVFNRDGALPTGLSEGVDYYVRDSVAGVSLKLAATSGGSAIDITAGTGEHFLGLKEKLKPYAAAILMLVGHWYENREATGTVSGQIEFGVNALVGSDGMANI